MGSSLLGLASNERSAKPAAVQLAAERGGGVLIVEPSDQQQVVTRGMDHIAGEPDRAELGTVLLRIFAGEVRAAVDRVRPAGGLSRRCANAVVLQFRGLVVGSLLLGFGQ